MDYRATLETIPQSGDGPHALFAHAIAQLRHSSAAASCKICGGDAHPYDMLDFKKTCQLPSYPAGLAFTPVVYRKCADCAFIFTDFFDTFSQNDWATHVYNDHYLSIDPDYVEVRPRMMAGVLQTFLRSRKRTLIGLDYGGGSGKLTALMRQRGFQYDCIDPFGSNDYQQQNIGKYNFVSVIEVFEHTTDPCETLKRILDMMDTTGPIMVMIGTEAHDRAVSDDNLLSWWYAAPRNGHISLFSQRALTLLGQKFGLDHVSVSMNPHVLFRGLDRREVRTRLFAAKSIRRAIRSLRLGY